MIIKVPEAGMRLCVPNQRIFYRSTSHGFIGPFEERQVQAWYREGYFYSEMDFRFEGKQETFTLSELRNLNGIACPFSFVETAELHRKSTSSSDSAIAGSVSSLMEISSCPSIEDASPIEQQIIITNRLNNEEAFLFADDVRLRLGDNNRSIICSMKKGKTSCFFYSSSLPREEHSFENYETWRVKGLLSTKKCSFLAIIADRSHIFSLLSSVIEASNQNRLPLLSHILLVCTGSIEFYSDIRSISRFLERRRFQRINTSEKSYRRFIKCSR